MCIRDSIYKVYKGKYSCIALSENNFKLKYMFRPIITEPVVFQITLVIAILLAVSVWQRLKIASGIVIAVYAIYMISFVSANTKLKTSKPIKLAVHANKTIDDPILDLKSDNISDQQSIKASQNEKNILLDTKISKKFPVKSVIDKKLSTNKKVAAKKDEKIIDEPFKILNMSTGTNVINRSIIEPNNLFTTDSKRVYFLSGVQNRNDSKVLFHKWYHDGKLKSKVQMESKRSFNWRSWSYITVTSQKIGDWQVVIEDQSGMRYDSLSFVISDYNI